MARISPLELARPWAGRCNTASWAPTRTRCAAISLEAAGILGRHPQAADVNFDWMEPARQIQIRINQDEARQLGISSAALAGYP